jgi:hypothetical protein
MYEVELVRTTTGQRITKTPYRCCPNGHELGLGRVLVDHVACLGHGSGGRTNKRAGKGLPLVYRSTSASATSLQYCASIDGDVRGILMAGKHRSTSPSTSGLSPVPIGVIAPHLGSPRHPCGLVPAPSRLASVPR